MARSVSPREIIEGLAGTTTLFGQSSSPPESLGSGLTASGSLPYHEREEFDHHMRMLEFVVRYQPHPAFAVGCLFALMKWYFRNTRSPKHAAVTFLDRITRVFRQRPIYTNDLPAATEPPPTYLDQVSHMFHELYADELRYVMHRKQEHDREQRRIEESAKLLTTKKE
jgi:hypothetical protein